MATLKQIKGSAIQFLDEDPVQYVGSWATGGAMGTGRAYMGGAGSQTAGLVYGGTTPSVTANTEEYNGTAWSEQNNLNLARSYQAGGGSQTAAISSGGYVAPADKTETEIYDGTSWTEVADINTGRSLYCGQAGSSTANLIFGGYDETAPNVKAITESWNGSAWTEVADLNTARYNGGGTGTQTSGILAGGTPGSGQTGAVELWNGSAWTETTDLNTSRTTAASGADNTAVLVAGGDASGAKALTENWDGTSWTEVADLGTANNGGSGNSGSTNVSTLNFGGTPGYRTQTEEWTTTPAADFTQINLGQVYFNSTSNAFKVTGFAFPTGTWASNTASPTAQAEMWGTGTSNSDALVQSPPGVSMEWNGSAWTNGGTTNFNGQTRGATGGIAAALIWGGSPNNGETEQYNGTAWTEVADLNTTGNQQPTGPTGTYTDTITAGRGPGWQAVSESWNGSAWTETSDLNTARRGLGSGGGSSTDAAVFGGNVPPNNASALTETWNGSSWTETTDLNTARFSGMGFGSSSQSVGYVAGGSYPASPPYNVKTEFFNGSTWTEVGDLANGRYHNKGGGTGASALTAGGYLASPAGGQTTENSIWTVDQGNLTITVS